MHQACHLTVRGSGTGGESSIDSHERKSCRWETELLIFCLLNDRVQELLNHRTYNLVITSSHYNNEAAWIFVQWAKQLQVQMKSQIFELFDPSPTVICHLAPKLACDTIWIHEGGALSLVCDLWRTLSALRCLLALLKR